MRVRVTKTIHLELSEKEAYWLKSVMQNPLDSIDPSLEDKEDRNSRLDIFECLNSSEAQ